MDTSDGSPGNIILSSSNSDSNASHGASEIIVTELNIKTRGAKKFNPTNIGLDDQYVHCSVKIPRSKIPYNLNETTDKKMIERMAVDHALGSHGLDKFAIPSKRSFLVKADEEGAGTAASIIDRVTNKKYSAIIILYSGLGKLDEAELYKAFCECKWVRANFSGAVDQMHTKKVWNDAGQQGKFGTRWHWVSVKFYDRNDEIDESHVLANLADLCRELAKALGQAAWKIHACHIPVEVSAYSGLSLATLISDEQSALLSVSAVLRREILATLLEKEYQDRPEIAVHGKKIFDTKIQQSNGLDAVRLTAANDQQLYANNNGETKLLQDGACSKLFFGVEQSVAEFMLEHFGNKKKLSKDFSNQDFNDALRGRLVQFESDEGIVARPIERVESTLVKGARDIDKHSVWTAAEHFLLKHPDLPCLNVGTASRLRLIPPEKCKLFPGQSFTKPYINGTKVDLAQHRAVEGSLAADHTAYAIQINKPEKGQNKQRSIELGKVLRKAFSDKVQVGFALVGFDSLPGGVWDEFIGCVLNIPMTRMQGQKQWPTSGPLTLLCRQGDTPMTGWLAQLKQLKDNCSRDDHQPVVVMLLSKEVDKTAIYREVKRIADTELGVQIYFMTTEMLEKHIFDAQAVREGAEKATGDLVCRMSTRQLQNASIDAPVVNLDVAIHIEESPFRAPNVDKANSRLISEFTNGYIVAFSAKHAGSSSGYSSYRELVFEDEIRDYDVAEALKAFIGRSTGPGKPVDHITIIRSGYVATQRHGVSKESEKICDAVKAHCARSSYLVLGPETPDVVGRSGESHSLSMGTLLLTDREVSDDSTIRKFRVHRIHGFLPAQKSKCSPFEVTKPPQPDHHQLRTTAIGMTLTGDCLDGTTFTDALPIAVSPSAPAQSPIPLGVRKSSKQDKPPADLGPRDSERCNHMGTSLPHGQEIVEPFPKTSLANRPLRDKSTDVSEQENRAPLRKSSVDVDGEDLPFSQLVIEKTRDALSNSARKDEIAAGDATDVGLQPSQPLEVLTRSEMQRIGQLWKDDILNLYDTQWPVITHLAHLVAKRARFHVRLNEKEELVLPPVHEDVADTLYFL